jgi:hypothetical protein
MYYNPLGQETVLKYSLKQMFWRPLLTPSLAVMWGKSVCVSLCLYVCYSVHTLLPFPSWFTEWSHI